MSNQNEEEPQYGIYNSKNIKLTSEAIQEILLKGGITEKINNIQLWQQAFVHKSYCKNNKKKLYGFEPANIKDIDPSTYMKYMYENSNEVLEWLGDGVLQSVVACYLSRRYVGQDEGFLTKLRSKLVKTEALSKMAKFLDMPKYIIMSEHVEMACNGRTNAKILEDAFESLLGALMEDFGNDESCRGYMIANKFIINCIESSVDITELILNDDNYKDRLMKYYQKMYNGQYPKYIEEESQEDKIYRVNIFDPEGTKVGHGYAKSKKEAEQRAAKQALYTFGIKIY